MATIRSPPCSPIDCAGDVCPACSSGATVPIVRVASPATVMKRIVNRTIASRMFAAGPAPIATRRFQVGAFQYASGPRASRSSMIPFSAEARAAGDIVCAVSSSSSSSTARCASVRSLPLPSSARFTRSTTPPSVGASATACESRRSASCGIGRCMPGMVTKPPSGIAPRPYSIPFRFVVAIAGGKPT